MIKNSLTKAKALIQACQVNQDPHLDLSNCGITNLNDLSELFECHHLETLNLRVNQISDISFLSSLTSLRSLDLRDNQILDISSLSNLTSLQSLDLSYNEISDVSSLLNLTSLQFLDLRSNKIREIPSFIFQLKMKLNFQVFGGGGLCLDDNPIESPPMEILKQGRESTLDWFKATKAKLNEIKIILIGDPKAGKTSLLRRLKDDSFDELEAQTDGVNIENIEFGQCRTFQRQTSIHAITGYFWDFGGQEIMNATHQFFLTRRSVYVLVLDARKDVKVAEQIRQWAQRIKTTGGNSPIIVVANQADVNSRFGFENEYKLQKEFPQIKAFVKASCKTKDNIDVIKDKLEALIPQAELFNTIIDERWVRIKAKLQEETKANYFLDEEQFLAICHEFDLKEKQAQKNVINFLHDLGLVLHFDDVNLSEYYVLDPYWITYGVYQILTSSCAGQQKGIVDMNRLEFIVNQEEEKEEKYRPTNYKKISYTNNQRRFLIDILNQFKLCFFVPDRSRFIVPDLLDTHEPGEITEPFRHTEDSIRFIYEYDYLPKSIMPHIMVGAHNILVHMWRTGCVLSSNGCHALLEDYQNRISIIIIGEHKQKRGFMAIIRHLIDSINQELSDAPSMLIPLPGVNAFVDYEELLDREKDGEQYYKIYKPIKEKFEIAKLLGGIPRQDEVRKINKKLDELLKDRKKIDVLVEDHKKILENQKDIKHTLNGHYDYLIHLPTNHRIKEDLLKALQEINKHQLTTIANETMQWLTNQSERFEEKLDDRSRQIYTDLQKTDNWEMKLKLAVPFINYLGIELEVDFDVKNWAAQMYEKHEIKLFKLLGYLEW